MSPLLGFTTMRDLIENGTKRQTIRLARKQPIKIGDTLYLYWKLRTKACEMIGITTCQESMRFSWEEMKRMGRVLALRDGFSSWNRFAQWFLRYHPVDDTEFDIIRWKFPLWNEGELRPASRRVKP